MLSDKSCSNHMDLTGEVLGFCLSLLCCDQLHPQLSQRHKQAVKYGFSQSNCDLSLLEVGMLSDVCVRRMCLCFHM